MSNVIKPGDDFQYYVPGAIYWNDFPETRARQNSKISTSPDTDWMDHVRETHGVADRALMVSCGNGWVERDLFRKSAIKYAYGFDIMPALIDDAKNEAEKVGMPSDYVLADGNNLDIGQSDFNIIVNNGAVHHIAFINRHLYRLSGLLAKDGLYVINDYTGPHRNQYDWETLSAIVRTNARLPKKYQIQVGYAHMPTMLGTDPTEAIHAELQMAMTRRYFTIEQEVKLGGGVAYTLLFGNKTLYVERETDEGRAALDLIFAADDELLSRHPVSNLFTFAVCRPKSRSELSQSLLDLWEAEEVEREAAAAANSGRYYPPTDLELIYNDLADARYLNSVYEMQLKDR